MSVPEGSIATPANSRRSTRNKTGYVAKTASGPETGSLLLSCSAEDAEVPSSEMAAGGRKLPANKFLTTQKVISLLEDTGDPLPSIPRGRKENVYFIVENGRNVARRAQGRPSAFYDDCGPWGGSGSSPKCLLLKHDDGHLTTVFDRQDHGMGYCVYKNRRGKSKLVSLNPQPDPDKIRLLHRYYTSLKDCSSYMRRVTWLDDARISQNCCVEYVGSFPGSCPHGNSRHRSNKTYLQKNPRGEAVAVMASDDSSDDVMGGESLSDSVGVCQKVKSSEGKGFIGLPVNLGFICVLSAKVSWRWENDAFVRILLCEFLALKVLTVSRYPLKIILLKEVLLVECLFFFFE